MGELDVLSFGDVKNQKTLFGCFRVNDELDLVRCDMLPSEATLILKGKDENKISIGDYKGCFVWISRTPINQDIEIYKILKEEKRMRRDELIKEINELPLFEKRDVKVRNMSDEWITQRKKAICEVGSDAEAVAFCWEKYSLIQFKDVFLPILESIDGEVDGYLGHYGGYANFTFYPEREDLKIDGKRLGLVAINSVDLSSSVIVKFCVDAGPYKFVVPSKVAGLRKSHKGNIQNVVKNYVNMVGKVKDVWTNIVTEFPKYVIVHSAEKESHKWDEAVLEIDAVLDKVKAGERLKEKMKNKYDHKTQFGVVKYTLWDLFEELMEEISNKEYKSDIHKEKKIDNISAAVFEYATALSL